MEHLALALTLAGLIIGLGTESFLSFVISPQLLAREQAGQAASLLPRALQLKIALSLIVSMVGWWSLVWVVSGGM